MSNYHIYKAFSLNLNLQHNEKIITCSHGAADSWNR